MLHRQRLGWGLVVFGGFFLAAWLLAGPAVLGQASKTAPAAKSPPEALNVYSDAANFQNNGAFDLAAEEWEKFLKSYPQDPLAAKAQHYAGVCYLQLKQLDKAAAAFEAVVKKYPNFDLLQDAYLNLGWCQYSLGGQQVEGAYAKAAATFRELVKKFPDSKHAEQALFYAGEADYNLGKKSEAIAAYGQLVEKYPQGALRSDALYALGVTQEELGQHQPAGKTYDLFLEEFPDHDLANEVRMRKAETVLLAGDFAAAEKMFAAVAERENFAATDHALYRQAFCLSKLDRFADAAKLYARIPAEFAQSTYAADAAMSAGRCYYRADQYAEAATWFQKALEGPASGRVEAAHWLCRIYLRDQQPQQAIDLAKRILPDAGDDPFTVQLQMDHADALYESEASRGEAVAMYLEIANRHPQHELAAQALYNAAFGALALGRHDEGLKHAETFLEAYPQQRLTPDVQYVAAECHLQRSEYAKAEKLYAQLIQSAADHPDRETWQVRLALTVYLQKKYADAIAALEPLVGALKNADNQAQAQFVLGVSRFYLDQFDGAVEALIASAKANPQWKQADEAMLFLARALRRLDRTGEAIQVLAKLLSDFPRSRLRDQAHYRYGEFSYAAEDYPTAIAQYDAVLEADAASPFAPYAIYGKGWAQLKAQAYPAAVASFRALLKNHPDHALVAETRLALGMSLRQAGALDEAVQEIDAYLRSQPAEPNKSDALYERGLAEVALKDFAKAAETFQQLLADNPQYAAADKVMYELAWAYKSVPEGANKAESVAAFAKLAGQHPDSPLAAEASFHVGESLYEQADYAAATRAYTAAKTQSTPGELREKATYKLGWSLFQDKKYQQALEQFTEQASEPPQGELAADALFMKAECLFRLEKYDEALPVYLATQKVPLASPVSQVLALLHGGQSALQTEAWEQAVKLLSQIPDKHPESPYLAEAHCELGRAQQNSGQEAAALSNYEKAAEMSRSEVGARARFMIGELAFARKEYSEAIRHFQRVMFGYGGEAAVPEAKKWQARAGFEAARCAEVQIRDAQGSARAELRNQAQQAYQYVIDKHPEDELAAQAKQRLEALSKL